MKALVFGMGLQGKATVHDLENSDLVDEIVVADQQIAHVEDYLNRKRYSKTRALCVDASRESELRTIIRQVAPDIIVCMLPPDFGYPLAKIGLEFNLPFVSSSYTGKLAELDAEARDRGLVILPEMGMDPGIDLVLARLALKRLDEVHGLYSYGAGLPELACADNPLKYKITWTFDGVLKSYKRPARFLDNGREISLPGEAIFRDEYSHQVEIPGFGSLEAFPNGDAVHYIDIFQLGKGVRDMGRFALRYPGHRRFWRVMAELGFLDDALLTVGSVQISPRQFLVQHLTPKLQFRDNERDVVILRVKAWGIKDHRKAIVTIDLTDYRDMETGFFAMNRTVGFTASIGAQMVVSGQINTPGVLSPARDVPPEDLLRELQARGMHVEQRIEPG